MNRVQTRLLAAALFAAVVQAQEPAVTLPGLQVRKVAQYLTTPTGIAFLPGGTFFVIEKNTGRVLLMNDGVQTPMLDLAVNYASERGLLGIALHPDFPTNPGVYLFWTCVAPVSDPPAATCEDTALTGTDSNNLAAVPVLGNRVDRFQWDPVLNRLVFDRNIIRLRSFQADGVATPPGQGDEGQPVRGNHDGGVIGFGPDRKLYIFFGDQGRRGQLQNLPDGPTAPNVADDQFGGPRPDNAHLSGVVLRLNDDGTAPQDNPFFSAGASIGGEVGANIQRVYAYGLRNSFGMAFEPRTGQPWISEHGDDAFDEINRLTPGKNGGWVQIMGPLARIAEYKQIETTLGQPPLPQNTLQQWRWPATRIAATAQEALDRMFQLPGSQYQDPEFSWKFAALPVGIEFLKGRALGRQYENNLFAGLAAAPTGPGYLIRFRLNDQGTAFAFDDPALADKVADNTAKYDLTESQSLIAGQGFGIITDIETSHKGTLYVVSLTNGAVYEIYRTPGASDDDDLNGGRPLTAYLSGALEIPPGDPDGSGTARFTLNAGQQQICYDMFVSAIEPATAAHIHRGVPGVAGPVVVPLTAPTSGASSGCVSVNRDLIREILQDPRGFYVNVHNAPFPAGAVRGQLSK